MSDIVILNASTHMRDKDMWSGVRKRMEIDNLFGLSSCAYIIRNPHSSAILTQINEILVNAVDRATEVKVTKIHVTYKDKIVSICNDGPGITLEKINGLYKPEVIFGVHFSSSNHNKDSKNIKGGINGVGAKTANVNSKWFEIETISNGQHYYQRWNGGPEQRTDPIITETKDTPYTKVTFLHDYDNFDKFDDPRAFIEIADWIRMRVALCNIYLKNVEMTFNGEICEWTSLPRLYLSFYSPSISEKANIYEFESTTTDPNFKQFKIRTAIITLPDASASELKPKCNLAVVNGMTHLETNFIGIIKNKIKEKIDTIGKLDKGVSPITISTLIRIVHVCGMPQVSYKAQNKEDVILPDVIKTYTIPDDVITRVANFILNKLLIKNEKEKMSKKVENSKHIPANYAKLAAKKSQTTLMVVEGDSARGQMCNGLKINDKLINSNYFGVISVQGVVVNAEREVDETGDGHIQSYKLLNNERLRDLYHALGLDVQKTYETDAEVATLNYGRVLICVDQDLDGVGKIAPLILVYFNKLWPALIKRGFIYRLMTPLIRVYLRDKIVKEFFFSNDYDDWIKVNHNKDYKINYYKGLATHEDHEIKHMFKSENFNNCIFKYEYDQNAADSFVKYFGDDSEKRKIELRKSLCKLDTNFSKNKILPITSVQMDYEVKQYKLDALNRQICGVIDGLNPARRKAIMAARDIHGRQRVSELAAATVGKYHYHHGEASMCNTIISMAQSYKGKMRFPLLTGHGNFGYYASNDVGAPRYINVSLPSYFNELFPTNDFYNLEYLIIEESKAEPKFLAPIIPINILESSSMVSEGWNHISYARKYTDVIRFTKAYINGEFTELAKDIAAGHFPLGELTKAVEKYPLTIETRGYNCEIKYHGLVPYCHGKYRRDKNKIIVTELPFGMFPTDLVDMFKNKKVKGEIIQNELAKYVKTPDNPNSDEVTIEFLPGKLEELAAKYKKSDCDCCDFVIDFLKIRTSIRANLNYYYDAVLEYGHNMTGYAAALLRWADYRRQMYESRLNKDKCILEIKLLICREKLRFIYICKQYKTIKDAGDDLEKHNFTKLNAHLLDSVRYDTCDQIKAKIMTNGTYNYLLDLRVRDLDDESGVKLKEKIKEIENDIENINKYLSEKIKGASLWLHEIDKLEIELRKNNLIS